MVILLILILQVDSNCCLNCANFTSDACFQCIPPYSLSNFTCVLECGTGYDSILGVCERNSNSLKFISTSFVSFQLYNLSTAGNFKSSDDTPLINAGNMIPTIDRGYYSDANSNLVGKSAWVPWTSFSFKLYFRPLDSSGKIFQVFNSDDSKYFEVIMENWFLTCKILIIGQESQVIQLKDLKNDRTPVVTPAWVVLYVHIKQIDADTVYIDLETQWDSVYAYLNDFELAINSTSLWVLGDREKLETVQGFYFSIEVTNVFSFSAISVGSSNLCRYRYYQNPADASCYPCDTSCDSRLNCVDDTTCSQCYSNQCSSCDGFVFGVCNSCQNGEVPPYCCPYLCRKCDTLDSCLVCHKGTHIFQSICLQYAPYLTLVQFSSPLLNVNFDGSFRGLYGLFRTGTSEKSFWFYQNPETLDPIPSKQRGLYFNGSSYLKNHQAFNPHPIMSMNWVFRPTANQTSTVFATGDIFQLVSNGLKFLAKLQTEDSLFNVFESTSVSNDYNVWYSVSYSITYTYPDSTHKFYYNNQLQLTETQSGVFRLTALNTYFGFNNARFNPNSSNFFGFLYSFTYWNSVVSDFSPYQIPTSCSFSSDINCVNSCEFNQYYSSLATCENCQDSCSIGCQDNRTCNICLDRLCANCSDFYNTCFLCLNNSQKVGQYCTCVDNSIDFINRCDLCDVSCGRCSSLLVNGCLECSQTGFVAVDGVCYSRYPNGLAENFNQNVDIELYELFSFSQSGALMFGTSNTDMQDLSDPVPDPRRGYYFKQGLKMEQEKFLLFYKFYFEVWIRFKEDGNILNHGNSLNSFIFNSNFFFNLTLFSNDVLSCTSPLSKTWTNLGIFLDLDPTNTSTLYFYLNKDLFSQETSSNIDFFIDQEAKLTIGGTGSFTGFLSRLKLVSTRSTINPITENPCIDDCQFCSSSSTCLSLCDFQFPASNCSDTCGRGCLNCYSNSKCQRCQTGMILDNGECICPKLFIWSLDEKKCIFSCFKQCLDCKAGPFLCSSCSEGLFLIENLCIECPSGFSVQEGSCFQTNFLNFHLVFNQISGKVEDQVSGIQGIAGENQSFYPEYDSYDPYYTDRGYYFNGISSRLSFKNNFNIFTPQFTLELWINRAAEASLILAKSTDSEQEISFQLFLVSGRIHLKFMNSEAQTVFLNTSVEIPENSWTFLQIFSEKMQNIDFSITCSVNSGNLQIIHQLSHDFLLDSSKFSSFSIGSWLKSTSLAPFKGFLYELKVYNSYFASSYKCENCPICTSAGKCLPNCSIGQFWSSDSVNDCKSCHPNCSKGCKNEKSSCNLCEDDLCHVCPSVKNCSKCIENAELSQNMSCTCISSYYYNGSSCVYCSEGYIKDSSCVKCEPLCLECKENSCLKCQNNSSLLKGSCFCDLGFIFTYNSSSCSPVEFYLNVSTSASNRVYLDFSEELKENLTRDDLILKSYKKIQFELEVYSTTRFVVVPEIDEKGKESAVLLFVNEIVSKRNGVIRGFSYNLTFTLMEKIVETDIEKQVRRFSNKLISYSTYAAASVTLINPTPASLWSFINSIQMLIYIYMFNIDLDERTSGFLIGLRKYNMFPNFFELLGVSMGVHHNFPKAVKMGYKTNSVMINTGKWISCFVFFICLYFAIFGLYKILTKWKLKSMKLNSFLLQRLKNYRYGFFIRFWIQGYIEFLISCFLAVYSTHLNLVDQALNFYFTLLFGDYPMVQLCLAEILMLFVTTIQMFFFILIKKPFDEPALNYANLSTELILCIIIPTFACFLFEISEESRTNVGYFLMVLINLIVGSQITASFFVFSKAVKQKIRMIREKKLAIQIQPVEEEKPQISEDLRKINVSPACSMDLRDPEIVFNRLHLKDPLYLDSHSYCGPSRSLKSRERSSQESLAKLFEDPKSHEDHKKTWMI